MSVDVVGVVCVGVGMVRVDVGVVVVLYAFKYS